MSKHTKLANCQRVDSCWNRAKDDEPVFVLRASDPVAISAINFWINDSVRAGLHLDKVDDASDCVNEMKRWADAKHSEESAPWILLRDLRETSPLRALSMDKVFYDVQYRLFNPYCSSAWQPIDQSDMWVSANKWLRDNPTFELRAHIL